MTFWETVAASAVGASLAALARTGLDHLHWKHVRLKEKRKSEGQLDDLSKIAKAYTIEESGDYHRTR